MIQDWLPHYRERIDTAITAVFDARYESREPIEHTYESALRYAVEWGGKRLRPILTCIAYEASGGKDISAFLTSLIGIEFIHCYTLVHDDLPCMDNDEYRRGQLTVWKKYGEAMAVLVGDTLQTMGFELLSESGDIRVVREIARALGDLWVARGQVRDTFLEHDALSLEALLRIHDEKTGGFIAACLVVGALLAGAEEKEIERLRSFGILLGRAFQIRDDILDSEGDASLVGKKLGKDVEAHKGIISLVGIDASRVILAQLESEMIELLRDESDERLRDIVEFVVHREQ